MKIFFYANVNYFDVNSGISKKVKSQIKAMRNDNNIVYYTSYLKNEIGIFNNDDKLIYSKKYRINSKIFSMVKKWCLLHTVNTYLETTEDQFELSYIRFHYFDPFFNQMLKKLKEKKIFTIVESHSYPYRTFNSLKALLTNSVDILFESSGKKLIDLVSVIGTSKNIWGRKTISIENSVDFYEIPIQKKIKGPDNQIRMISVTYEREYHGFDRLIKGLKKYYELGGKIDFQINLVGKYLKQTVLLVKKLDLENNVHFHGLKNGEDLINVYNHSDIAIGALGNRSNAEYGSTIKTKEYFAIGIPFINGWKEYSFDDSYPYVLRFDWKNDEIDFQKIEEFYKTIGNNANVSTEMREFAKEHFSYEKQWALIRQAIEQQKLEG